MREVTVDTDSFVRSVGALFDDLVGYVLTMRPTDRITIECTSSGLVVHVQPGLFRLDYPSTEEVIVDDLVQTLARALSGSDNE